MHVFIKIPAPVDRPIEFPFPLLPPVCVNYILMKTNGVKTILSRYDIPAGQDRDGNRYGEDFKGKSGYGSLQYSTCF